LGDGAITGAHVDAVTRASKQLDTARRGELLRRADRLAKVATVEEFSRRLALETKRLQEGDGIDRLERQRRNARAHSSVDAHGMWNPSARYDPVTGVRIAARIDTMMNALFGKQTPDGCPDDPIEKQRYLTALAGDANTHAVVVRNGVVRNAPGELNLGRTTRLANRAQRRALRGLYRTCAIPGCAVHYDRCKLHHVIWWRNQGRTDLNNLLPVCAVHHGRIHNDNWVIELGPNRELTLTLPDGTTHATGPPGRSGRSAAA
jgi:hypothetical protein